MTPIRSGVASSLYRLCSSPAAAAAAYVVQRAAVPHRVALGTHRRLLRLLLDRLAVVLELGDPLVVVGVGDAVVVHDVLSSSPLIDT